MCWCIGAGFTWMVGSHQVSSLDPFPGLKIAVLIDVFDQCIFASPAPAIFDKKNTDRKTNGTPI